MSGLNGEQANDFNEMHHKDFLEEWEYNETIKNKSKSIKLNVMETSKVKTIQSVKEWNGQNGTVYYHNLEMENGDKINIGKKKNLNVGDELNYEITEQDGTSEYSKAKTPNLEKQQSAGGGNKDAYTKGIEVGHAVNNAVNLTCAGVELDIPECKTTAEKIYQTAKVIMAISEQLKSE